MIASGHNAQQIIDQTLQVVADDARRIEDSLGRNAGQHYSLEELRTGPLGQDLGRLALVAAGVIQEPQERVLAAIDAVLEVLFWAAGGEGYSVPRSFWDTDLGSILARAKFRAVASVDLLAIHVAARELGVSRPTIYRWIDDRSLDSVHDEVSGRTFVVRTGFVLHRLGAGQVAESHPLPT